MRKKKFPGYKSNQTLGCFVLDSFFVLSTSFEHHYKELYHFRSQQLRLSSELYEKLRFSRFFFIFVSEFTKRIEKAKNRLPIENIRVCRANSIISDKHLYLNFDSFLLKRRSNPDF